MMMRMMMIMIIIIIIINTKAAWLSGGFDLFLFFVGPA
jgi:hypothetical protein